jgi:hypothetical protein
MDTYPGRWWTCKGCGKRNSWTARECASCSRIHGTAAKPGQEKSLGGTVKGKVIRPLRGC